MDEHARLTEAAIRISHFLQSEHRNKKMAGSGSGAALVRERLEAGGIEIDGLSLTLREGLLLAWAGHESDPLYERLVRITLRDA